MVQLPEPSGDRAMPTIAAMTRERAAAAGERIAANPADLMSSGEADTGFRAFRLSSSNFSVWDIEY